MNTNCIHKLQRLMQKLLTCAQKGFTIIDSYKYAQRVSPETSVLSEDRISWILSQSPLGSAGYFCSPLELWKRILGISNGANGLILVRAKGWNAKREGLSPPISPISI